MSDDYTKYLYQNNQYNVDNHQDNSASGKALKLAALPFAIPLKMAKFLKPSSNTQTFGDVPHKKASLVKKVAKAGVLVVAALAVGSGLGIKSCENALNDIEMPVEKLAFVAHQYLDIGVHSVHEYIHGKDVPAYNAVSHPNTGREIIENMPYDKNQPKGKFEGLYKNNNVIKLSTGLVDYIHKNHPQINLDPHVQSLLARLMDKPELIPGTIDQMKAFQNSDAKTTFIRGVEFDKQSVNIIENAIENIQKNPPAKWTP